MSALISDNIEDDEEMSEEDELDEELEEELSDEEFKDAKEELSEEEENEEINPEEEEEDNNDLDVDEDCTKEFVYESSEEEESNDESNEESDTESIDDEFRMKIKNALGNAAIEEEEDEIVFDDEQMLKFDEAISNVFKEKKKLKSKKLELTEFKSRCFDLVQILLNNKEIESSFLIEIAKNTLELLSKKRASKSFDLIFKASATLKQYQTIEHSKQQSTDKHEAANELLKKSLNLVSRLPEKVRNNLHCFIIWLLDFGGLKDDQVIHQLILKNFDKKLKKSPETALLTSLAERKKILAQIIFDRLIQIDLKSKLSNSEYLNYFKLISACCLDQQLKIDHSSLQKLLNNSLDLLGNIRKKEKKFRFLIEELIRFLTIFLKNHLDAVKSDDCLVRRLLELSNDDQKLRLSKKLRQKFKYTLKTIN